VTAAILECEASLQTVGRSDLGKWADVIRAEYLEFPGLSLTAPQVQRLWNLDRNTCQCLLDAMVREKFLKQTAHAQYVRADWCRACEVCE
jgi:hypothetical protein